MVDTQWKATSRRKLWWEPW